MMYCTIGEAFDNPLEQNKKEQYKEHNMNKRKESIIKSVEDSHYKKNIMPSFFTAQGDISSEGPYFGTTISELKSQEEKLSFDDSLLDDVDDVDDVSLLIKNKKKEYSHNECINKFINNIIDDKSDFLSLVSTKDDIYDHIKQCKYCRTEINMRLKNFYNSKDNKTKQESGNKPKSIEKFNVLSNKFMGYEYREVFIVILAGIIIIFILDLLVRIGRKTIKLDNK